MFFRRPLGLYLLALASSTAILAACDGNSLPAATQPATHATAIGVPAAASVSQPTNPPSGPPPAATRPVVSPTPAMPIAVLEQLIAKAGEQRVKSPDGALELLLPEGSLPAGVAPSQVKMQALAPADAAIGYNGEPPLATYRLEPDGLTFASPVVVRIAQPLKGAVAIPVLLAVSKDGVERLAPTDIEIDRAAGKVFFSAPIVHFSDLSWTSSRFHIEMSEPGAHFVGESFPVSVTISIDRKDYKWEEPDYQGRKLTAYELATKQHAVIHWIVRFNQEEGMRLSGEWRAYRVTPTEVKNAPPTTRLESDRYTVPQNFTCVEPGWGPISYNTTLDWREDMDGTETYPWTTHTSGIGRIRDEHAEIRITGFVTCSKPGELLTTPVVSVLRTATAAAAATAAAPIDDMSGGAQQHQPPTSTSIPQPVPVTSPTPTATATKQAMPTPTATPTAVAAAPTDTPTPVPAAPTTGRTATPTTAPAVPSGDANKGKDYYLGQGGCVGCHGQDAKSGPARKDLSAASPSLITTRVRQGQGRMPSFQPEKLSDADLLNLIAYLQSLK